MAKEKSSDPLESNTDLGGMFYPVGRIIAAFPSEEQARAVQKELRDGGLSEEDCRLYSSERVAEIAGKDLAENTGWLATLGKSDEAVQRALDAARDGAWFLLINAPADDVAARAMEAVRRGSFTFAHRYHRLAIEEMK